MNAQGEKRVCGCIEVCVRVCARARVCVQISYMSVCKVVAPVSG